VTQILWWGLAVVTLTGAIVLLLAREVMRAILGLGTFLVGLAGLYAFYAVPFLAVAQIFVYVGGVLVLFLFAIMALTRDAQGHEGLESRFDIGALATAIGFAVLLAVALRPMWPKMTLAPVSYVGVDGIAAALLGPMLPLFEAAGVALLAALVAAIAVSSRRGVR
jgi:NAD(P)H-quinone oxidoreductase subunit 6